MRILIVEDNPRIAAVLRKGLAEEGYVVESAPDGDAGLEAALAGGHDALVIDVMLPKRDGIELVRALREAGVAAPVLLLTARDRTEDKVAGLDAGADDYVTKPFDFSELAARLRALLRRAPAGVPAVLEVGDLALDPATREVRRDGVPIPLTPKEFALLEFLMRNPERALSRTAIMERVWGIRFDPGTNVVDVFINSLRNKLDPERRRIHTVRGVGYLLRAPDAEAG